MALYQSMLDSTSLLNSFSAGLYRESESLLLYRGFRKAYDGFTALAAKVQRLPAVD